MSDTDHLVWLSFSTVRGTKHLYSFWGANHGKIAPEGCRHATIIGVFDDLGEFSVLD